MNRINPYASASVNAYQRPAPAPSVSAAEAPAKAEAPAASAARPTDAAAVPLSAAEQQMIDRAFPPSPEMALRVYGPSRQAQSVRPGALGSRLDLRG